MILSLLYAEAQLRVVHATKLILVHMWVAKATSLVVIQRQMTKK